MKIFLITILVNVSLIFADPCSAPLLGASHSGAPGEVSCAGCHSGSPNTGPGNISYIIGENMGTYSPNELYEIVFTMEQDGVNQFGFQTVALKASNNTNTGTFSLTDPVNTRLIYGMSRTYVGHTVCGADVDPPGANQWSFNWQAPNSDVGDINFYLASLATNHSHNPYGDHTYIQVITLSYDDYLMGDLNSDGVINVLDIIVEVNIILGITIPNDYQLIVGDLNSDSDINILDIVQIVNIILGID